MMLAAACLMAQLCSANETNCTARLCGRVIYARTDDNAKCRAFVVECTNGTAVVQCRKNDACAKRISPGDHAVFEGIHWPSLFGEDINLGARCLDVVRGEPLQPIDTDISELLEGKFDFKRTRIAGTLRDATFSETYPGWIILVMCSRRERIFVSVQGNAETLKRFKRLIGAKVSAIGVCTPSDPSTRMRVGRTFKVENAICIAEMDSGDNPVRIPDIGEIRSTRESEILSLGYHRATGRVIAAWQGRKALIRMCNGTLVRIEFTNPPLPRFGETIQAVGLPESDLFRLNLFNASWESISPPIPDTAPATPVTPDSIVTEQNGHRIINNNFHGKPISIKGEVRSISTDGTRQMHVECDGHVLLVDANVMESLPDGLAVGACVKISGTCILEQDARQRLSAFPQLKNFVLVMRTPDDIVVLAKPPWWTPSRLMIVIGLLLAILLGVIMRNWTQKRNAARIAKLATKLKVEERTRLAVELHDSLAQNLSGISLEIDTASKLAENDPKAMREHLDRAARTLKSSRDELRNCLWDLRNHALEESSMDEAIRYTLAPHIRGLDVVIRFNVPRTCISDNTAHAILRIVRELAINAVRHGHATKLWIAGGIDADKIMFSVRDNGAGFVPDAAPGFAEGHYGLVGISERVESLEGEFKIESAPGSGAKATISMKATK